MDWRAGECRELSLVLAVMRVVLNIDNVFDVDYRQYLDQNQGPGLNVCIGMTLRFGAAAAETPAR
jgi:hypothetical protein